MIEGDDEVRLLTIRGDRPSDEHLDLEYLSNSHRVSISGEIRNTLKNGKKHTGDFAMVHTRREVVGNELTIMAMTVDMLTVPDSAVKNYGPDARASRALIETLTADPPPVIETATYKDCGNVDIDPTEDWSVEGVDMKRQVRGQLLGWAIKALKDKFSGGDSKPIYWNAGVYNVIQVVIDMSTGRGNYIAIGSGDVECTLRKADNTRHLYVDTNGPADMVDASLKIGWRKMYETKVYRVYDALGPRSGELCGPFCVTTGAIDKGRYVIEQRTDGHRYPAGTDDVTSAKIELDIYPIVRRFFGH